MQRGFARGNHLRSVVAQILQQATGQPAVTAVALEFTPTSEPVTQPTAGPVTESTPGPGTSLPLGP